VFDGDPDELVETEESYWQNFDGLDSWELHRYENPDALRGVDKKPDEGCSSVLEEQQAKKAR
jgi:hypothetical protein